jgi:hypothetical protein
MVSQVISWTLQDYWFKCFETFLIGEKKLPFSFLLPIIMKVKIVMTEPSEVIDPFIAELAACIDNSKRVLVITGAGISCNGGIPVSTLYTLLLFKSDRIQRTFGRRTVYMI